MPLSPDELELRHGYFIRPLGNRFVVFGANGFEHSRHRTESLAVRELLKLRQAWIAGYYAATDEANQHTRKLLATA